MAGKPPGAEHTSSIVERYLKFARRLSDADRKSLAAAIGEDVEKLSNKELVIASQINRAITKGSTESAKFLLTSIGEYADKSEVVGGGEVIVIEYQFLKSTIPDPRK